MAKPLPPPGTAPKRLTPPEKRRASGDAFPVEPDASTPAQPVTLTVYQELLATFDDLLPAQRLDLIELGQILKDLTSTHRAVLVAAGRQLLEKQRGR